jgi:hypothetical protein
MKCKGDWMKDEYRKDRRQLADSLAERPALPTFVSEPEPSDRMVWGQELTPILLLERLSVWFGLKIAVVKLTKREFQS